MSLQESLNLDHTADELGLGFIIPQEIIFLGYEDLCSFWGSDTVDIDVTEIPDKFLSGKVIYIEDDCKDENIRKQCDKDGVIIIDLNGEKFEVFSMKGDIGFNSCVFLAQDYHRLKRYNPRITFIENISWH